MYCRNCGTANPDDATFCQKCGADLRTTPSSTSSPTATGSSSPQSGEIPQYAGANPMPTTMNVMGTIRHAIDLLRNPKGVMTAYRDSDPQLNSLMINYVGVLAGITFVATLIGDAIALGAGAGFVYSLLAAITSVLGVFIVGFVLWKLAPSFNTTTTQIRATRLAAYSYTPYFLISVLNIIPYYPIHALFGLLGLLYGLYIIYLGLPILLGTPQQQVITYLVVSLVVVFVVYFVLSYIVGLILLGIFGLGLGVL